MQEEADQANRAWRSTAEWAKLQQQEHATALVQCAAEKNDASED